MCIYMYTRIYMYVCMYMYVRNLAAAIHVMRAANLFIDMDSWESICIYKYVKHIYIDYTYEL